MLITIIIIAVISNDINNNNTYSNNISCNYYNTDQDNDGDMIEH